MGHAYLDHSRLWIGGLRNYLKGIAEVDYAKGCDIVDAGRPAQQFCTRRWRSRPEHFLRPAGPRRRRRSDR